MKKLLALLLAFAMVFTLAACGAKKEETAAAPEEKTWEWSERVEIMVPAGEGGGLDSTVRKFATYLEKELGTTVSVQCRTGNSGVTGYTWSHNATNDGYAYQFTAPSALISDAQGHFEGFKLKDELIPVSGLVQAEGLFVCRTDAPWDDAAGMIAYMKEHPEAVTCAVDSPNGISGAIMTEFEEAAGVKFKWITSDSAEGYISVISKDIDVCINTWSDVGAYIESGDLKAVLVMADEHNEAYPDVTTAGDLGLERSLGYYRVFTALQPTPQEACDAFEAAVHKAAQNPEWIEWLAANGMNNNYLWTSEELAQVIDTTYATIEAIQ